MGAGKRSGSRESAKERTLESTREYMDWFVAQDEPVQEATRAYVKLLIARGPELGRPYVDTLKGSAYPNLKELRVQAQGRKYRIAFIFTGDRVCLLLTGDVKGGSEDKRFYRKLIARAETLYEEYLATL
ncbi:MAG: type II toxin-antitoxin system RelE/ParE family toxin [Treponema sp.]|nr:type II toxin-antitoxin system RelE/ParE family toxin [Treponema sp.]